ncbi:LOB domain-containing protein 38-like [Abrus precatorius]|uniref:LOB domain-containing protein 38-like n=1 Tax=Abrus precatorius TaxID=3816 RepID=A0A8B8LXY8_ABRPR|nr:LOB domain-containing protein 38-like [Abrus precatorius]
MSCNGCRALRKGCSEDCVLRHCLQWIENPQAQAHATLFVARFFGRATLISFLSSVPTNQRSGMFRSLLYEAVGRAVNPVNGAVGLLWSGKWNLCQLGVENVLRGAALTPLPHHSSRKLFPHVNVAQPHTLLGSCQPLMNSEMTTLPSTTGDTASQTKLLTLFF